VIRSSKTRRRLGWLAVVAMLLVACAPTISRVRAALVAGQGVHAQHMAMHHHGGDPEDPDDCWSKCGYCNFLANTPAIDSVEYVAPLVASAGSELVPDDAVPAPPHAPFAQAAKPRGPPSIA
jgi:hypothetical protein